MENKNLACGMYSTRIAAQKTIDELNSAGFSKNKIHILNREKPGHHDFVHSQPTNIRYGAFLGAVVGFMLLGLVGFFLGYKTVPTMILSTLAGGVLGIIFGGASGALAGIGIPFSVHHRYRFYLQEGGLMLAVRFDSPEENEKATDILKRTGAQDVAGLYNAEVWELALRS